MVYPHPEATLIEFINAGFYVYVYVCAALFLIYTLHIHIWTILRCVIENANIVTHATWTWSTGGDIPRTESKNWFFRRELNGFGEDTRHIRTSQHLPLEQHQPYTYFGVCVFFFYILCESDYANLPLSCEWRLSEFVYIYVCISGGGTLDACCTPNSHGYLYIWYQPDRFHSICCFKSRWGGDEYRSICRLGISERTFSIQFKVILLKKDL